MAIENVISDVSNLTPAIDSLLFIFRIIGGLLGIYILFWIVNFFINLKKNNLLKQILAKLEEINKKLEKNKK
jgi:hypothetical protein